MRSFIFITILLLLCAYNVVALPGENKAISPTMPALRAMLLDMADKDQAIRKTLVGITDPSAELMQPIIDIDESNTAKLKLIYAKNGWPNSLMIGRDGVNAFWLLVQHSPDFNFQKTILPHVKTAFNNGDIDGQCYAMFIDRLLVHEGKPQKYGTQIKNWVNKTPIPYTIENRSNVNTARASIGLFDLEDYLLLVRDAYFPDESTKLPFSDKNIDDDGNGIGFQLDIKGSGPIENMTVKSLTVVKVLTGSAASKAGVEVGDQIIEIDGLPVEGSNINTLISAIEKPAGETVTFMVKRPDNSKSKIIVEVTARTPD